MSLLIQEDPGLARKRKLAEAMMQRGQRTGPVSHWTEGLSRVIDQGAGAYFANKAASQEEARKKASMESLAQAMAGNGMQPDGMGPPQPFMSRLENVEGINPEMIASLKLQQAMAPTPRDPVADAVAIAQGTAKAKAENPRPETPTEKALGFLVAEKTQADIDLKNRKLSDADKAAESGATGIQTAADQLVKAVQHPGFLKNFGKGDAAINAVAPKFMQSQERIDAGNLLEQVKNLLTVAARGALKGQGPITEGETAMLERSLTTLNDPYISDEAAKEEAIRLFGWLGDKGANIPTEVIQALRGGSPSKVAQPESGFSIKRIDD